MTYDIRKIELLAPAKDANTAFEAIKHGADAVYMGATAFGARSAAYNSIEDIKKVVEFAHQYGVKIYVTVNTIVFDNELKDVENLIKSLYRIHVDALIVQDMGILRLDIPPIELHASTQCDIRTVDKAVFFEKAGFSQLVLARELTFGEISDISKAVSIPIECFIHGALCVSYSGCCQVSHVLRNRSANRGECAQICRLPFDLVDDNGNVIVKNKHLLSLKDFNQSERLQNLLEAGVSSFKIEGRLKDIGYVKNVVAYYRKKIDEIIAQTPDKYIRSSAADSAYSFSPNLYKSFNRSFTHYFFDERNLANNKQIASINTPKSIGEPIGVVRGCHGRNVVVDTTIPLHNGDGLSYFANTGEYCGFRVNSVNGKTVNLFNAVKISPQTKLYRTFDASFENSIKKESADRKIKINAKLGYVNGYLYLSLNDQLGNWIKVGVECVSLEAAKTSQERVQSDVLGKLGDTFFQLDSASVLDNIFIPLSVLSNLRRLAVGKLQAAQRIRYKYGYRRLEDYAATYPDSKLTYKDNVSNKLSKSFYKSHGVDSIEPALEIECEREVSGKAVMHTRYCLRRELGACKKCKNQSKQLPDNLYLIHGKDIKLKVVSDCKNCEMKLFISD